MIQTKTSIVKEAEFMASFVDNLLSEGRANEAREVVTGELSTLAPEDINGLLRCRGLLAKIERATGNFHAALKIHLDTYPLARLSDNHILKARFFCCLAITYEELGYADRALIEYEAARFHYEEAGNREEVGILENNIAVILAKLDRVDEARLHLENARTYFDDPVRLAEIGVTEAEIYLQTGEPEKALSLLIECQRAFEKHGAKALFDKTIPVLIKAACDYQFVARGQR